MVSPAEVAAGGVAAETASPAVKADAVEGSSGPAVSRDAARRVKGKKGCHTSWWSSESLEGGS